MSTITQFGEYQDGMDAGLALAELFKELGTDIDELERPSAVELEDIFQFIWSQNTITKPYQSLIGFFTAILRRETYSTEIVDIFGTTDFIKNQGEGCSSVWTLPQKSRIIAFGSWTGDVDDGDSWCLDLNAERIICIPICFPETIKEAQLSAYAVLPELGYLEGYLRKSSELRGYIQKRNH